MGNRVAESAIKKTRKRLNIHPHSRRHNNDSEAQSLVRVQQRTPPMFPPEIKPRKRKLSVDISCILPVSDVAHKTLPSALKKPIPKESATKRKNAAPAIRKSHANAAMTKTPPVKKLSRQITRGESQAKLPNRTTSQSQSNEARNAQGTQSTSTLNSLQAQETTPLPRSHAVTVYRKKSIFDLLGYWFRRHSKSIAKLRRKPAKRVKMPPDIVQILAENVALRKEVDRLRSMQTG